MENEKLKQQLRDLCIAADGLATAMHLFYANVSSDILDHIIEEAEKENIRQRNIRSFDEHISKHHTVGTPCGPVRVVDTDKVSKEELGEMIHHCGQDADDACCQARHFNMEGYRQVIIHEGNIPADQEGSFSLKDLLGMQVVGIGKSKCDGCPADNDGDKCVKIEAVGGIYICLAKPQQEEPNRPVISFDDDNEESPDNIMARIKEKADDFMDYLNSVVKG